MGGRAVCKSVTVQGEKKHSVGDDWPGVATQHRKKSEKRYRGRGSKTMGEEGWAVSKGNST
jgi:hypothetical protein